MPEPFDAYHRWLGIPPKDQPPNHYRLLAVDLFEADPDVIEAGADRQMGHLRTYQTGKHAALSQQLLNEVAAAKICLLNPQKKVEYDAGLRQQLAASAPPGPPAREEIDPELAALVRQRDRPANGQRSLDVAGRPRPSPGMLFGAIAAGLAVILLCTALVFWPRGDGEPTVAKSPAGLEAPGGSAANPRPLAEVKKTDMKKGGKPESFVPPSRPAGQEGPQPAGQSKETGLEPPAPADGKADVPAGLDPWKGIPQWEEGPSPRKPSPEPPPGKKPRLAVKEPPGQEPRPAGTKPPPGKTPSPPKRPQMEPEPTKAALPTEAELEKARKMILEVYQKEYDQAATPEDREALARKLLAVAQQKEKDAAGRFALLTMARDLAEQARDGETALEAIDELAAAFPIDAVEMKTQLLERFAKVARLPAEHALIAEAAQPLADEAALGENFALAERVGRLAQSEAGKSRSKELSAAARAGNKQVQESKRAFEEAAEARESLKANPQDAGANLTVGRYLCFVRRDWKEGLTRLASSADEALKALAQRDLARPGSPDAKVALGNGWWDQGEKETPAAQDSLRLRAGYWYREAVIDLPDGLEKTRILKRLEEVAAIEAASQFGPGAKKTPYRKYEGTWIVRYANGTGRRYVIDANGEVVWGGRQGKLTRLEGYTVIDLGDRTLDRVRLVGRALRVEHFNPRSAFPKQVALAGIGERLQKDEKEPSPARLYRALQGIWAVKYGDNKIREYAIDAKGNVLFPGEKKRGALVLRDGELLLDFQDGQLERLEPRGPALWVEHFRSAADYPHFIVQFGVGARKQ